MSEFIENAFSI
jgi:hypothetical protein